MALRCKERAQRKITNAWTKLGKYLTWQEFLDPISSGSFARSGRNCRDSEAHSLWNEELSRPVPSIPSSAGAVSIPARTLLAPKIREACRCMPELRPEGCTEDGFPFLPEWHSAGLAGRSGSINSPTILLIAFVSAVQFIGCKPTSPLTERS
jgi:hypothetical protein